MGQSRLRIWRGPRQAATILVTALIPIAALLSVAVGGDTATAAPAAGYAFTSIPITESGPAAAVNPATDTIYIASYAGPSLLVVDAATHAMTATIPLSQWPAGVAVDPVTNTVYVSMNQNGTGTRSGSAAVAVIDGNTNQITDTIPLASNASAVGVGVNSSTDTIYVAEDAAGAVAVIDGSTNSVTTTVSTGAGSEPSQLAVDETTNVVWAGDLGGHVLGISGASNTVTQTTTVAGGAGVQAVAVNPASNIVYADTTIDGVAVIAGSTGAVSTYITGPRIGAQAGGIAVDPGSGTVFVTSADFSPWGTTWVINDATNTITDTIPRGGLQIVADTATGLVYEPAYSPDTTAWLLTPAAANAVAPLISSAGATLKAGVAGSFTIVGSAVPAATYTETGALPAGLTLSSSGVLSGTPATGTAGIYPMTLTASNGVPPDGSALFTLTISEAPTFTSADQATFQEGVAGSFTVTATTTNPSYPAGFTEAGALPEGVILSSAGLLSGTPADGTAGVYPITITASTGLGGISTQAFTLTVEATGSSYVPMGPVRVLDTRNGTGAPAGPVGPGGMISVQVAGVDGVPLTGVTAVVLNVTATGPTASSYVTVYPDGSTRPTASSLNFTAGETIPNLVTVPVTDGKVDFYNHTGTVNLIADLAGYYTSGAGSLFVPAGPLRVMDMPSTSAALGPNSMISLKIAGANGVPSTGVTAVVLNVTATDPTASSYLTVYPDGSTLPTASNLNFTAGETIANLVVVPVSSSDGMVTFYNHSGSVSLIADLAGYYTTSGTGSLFVPAGPARVLDTRNGTGHSGAAGPNGTFSLQITGVGGLPASGVTAVVLNVTATDPTASGYLTVYPDLTSRPTASNLNFTAGETIANMVTVPVGTDGAVDFYNLAGSTSIVADLAGYFTST